MTEEARKVVVPQAGTKSEIFFSLGDPQVRDVLGKLHAEADRQRIEFVPVAIAWGLDQLLGRKPSVAEEAARTKDLYIPLSREAGTFAYLVARSLGARRVVEFGTSFGISTIYLAAAMRDNGGGLVVGSEIEPSKIRRARENVAAAGLAEYVQIREGDARETLRDPGGVVDLALLDGMKDLYVPILDLLKPSLRGGSVVLADNIKTFPTALAPYLAWVRDPRNGFHSVTLPLGEGMEYSVRL
jgi:predicted O-methyltransferase YrrM